VSNPLKQAEFVLETLEELVADTQIDFGPAYAGSVQRRVEAIAIMQAVVSQLKRNQQRSSP
jgi:hypothetical protein